MSNPGETYAEHTKKYLGYTEEKVECSACEFSEEKENPMLDRDWFLVCNFSRVVSFAVKPCGRCNVFTPKHSETGVEDGAKAVRIVSAASGNLAEKLMQEGKKNDDKDH